jgi:hypothetical protein
MTRSAKIMRLRVSDLRWRVLGVVLATFTLVVVSGCSPAFASVLWRLDSNAAPSELVQGQQARIIATANNIGDTTVDGSGAHPVILTDRLPARLKLSADSAVEGTLEASDRSVASSTLACSAEEAQRIEVRCKTASTTQPVAAFTQLRVVIPVEAQPGAVSGEQNTVTISGGESPSGEALPARASVERAITIGEQATPFGLERYELTPEEEDGSVDLQAGSHPFQLTTTLDLNEALSPEGEGQALLEPSAPALARNLNFELPPGLLGDPQAVAQCSDADFSSIGENNVNSCPADSAIGVALVTLNLPNPPLGVFTEAVPVFNLVPAPGEPARFGLEDTKVPIILDTSVRTGGDYGVNVSVENTTQPAQLLASQVVLWGEPQSPAHDGSRGWACIRGKEVNGETCTPPVQRTSTPFLTLPTACLGGLDTHMNGQAWSGALTETGYAFQNGLGEPLASLEGCAAVPFDPSIAVQPVGEGEGQAGAASVSSASTPTGLNVDVRLPAEADGLGESAVRSTKVTLPAGVQLNPSAANGLQACSEAQIGYQGAGASSDPFSPGTGEPLRFSSAPASCPNASKVGVVRIKSPDLEHELEGGVYIAEQEHNPLGSLFALYMVAEDPVSGVRVKLAGEVSLNEETGQATSTFADTPQVPFERLSLRFFEGPRASLSTPPLCGTYTTLASFTPWSAPTPQTRETSFPITTGAGGSPCTSSEPFQPAAQAGSASNQAGMFTSFTLTLAHPDGDQALRAISLQLPPGIAAILASVTPCPEPQAAEQRCGPQSAIGSSTAYAGLGNEPVVLPGTVYLTGPYEGAPFGIEVVTPAVAGPFNLGVVTVRSRINVNPHTAQVTITSDPIPIILKGVPAQIKTLNVTVNRPNFQFNPTNCTPMSITSTLTGAQGANANVSTPFQVAGCQNLRFDPRVSAGTEGRTSKADGASLGLTFKSGAGEARVAKTILTIPAILPARLTTIQKACIAAVFEENPAACPEGSVIGTATVHTPVLKNPVAGPIYLVSHGNAAWPDAELVLQGEGITVILDGQTAIKKGITTSSFESVPDVPFETVEAILPEGPHSALTTDLPARDDYSLCGQNLAIPTSLTGQNGTLVAENVKVAVQGCRAVRASNTKRLTRQQQLARALNACRNAHLHARAKRIACERGARKRWSRDGLLGSRSARVRAGRRSEGVD